ncbi:16150_t:CDS:2, partial [Funneliformis geosporum]
IDDNIINENDNDNIIIDKDSEDNESVLNDKKSDNDNDKEQIFPNNTQISLSEINNIINFVKKAIYDMLFEYFNSPPEIVVFASLLDSRFKKMYGWPEEVCEMAIS